MDSITTQLTFCAIRCSRSARTWLVVAPHVLTVADLARPLWPWTRTQTFASFFEQSIPAHRGCLISITHHFLVILVSRCGGVCFGEGGVKQESDTRARRQHSTVPVDKIVPSAPR